MGPAHGSAWSARSCPVSPPNFTGLIHFYLFVWLIRLGRLLEERGQDTVRPFEGRQVVRAVQLTQRDRLRIDHQRLHLRCMMNNAGTQVCERTRASTAAPGAEIGIVRQRGLKTVVGYREAPAINPAQPDNCTSVSSSPGPKICGVINSRPPLRSPKR